MPISLAVLAASGNHPGIFLALGFVAGVVLFVLGFRTYREYRILADTPLMPVRSLAMGLGHVRGKATGGEPLTSPLTRRPCYYYKVQVERWVEKDKNESGWENVSTDRAERNFYLDDGTGKCL